jgi:hypothetical protein
MSWFLFIGLPYKLPSLQTELPDPIELRDVTGTELSLAVCGEKQGAQAYAVLVHGYSTDLLDKGPVRERCSQSFVHFMHQLTAQLPAASFLTHLCRGDLEMENVVVREKRDITWQEFIDLYPRVEEDVRYILKPGGTRG